MEVLILLFERPTIDDLRSQQRHLIIMGNSTTLTDRMRKFVGHFRPLLSHLLLALSYHLRLCISLSFRLAHILPSRFRRRPRKAKRRALMIGISVVTDQPSAEELADSSLSPASTPEGGLKGPHGEARAMGALLEVQYGYSPDDIVYLLDLPGYEYPTRDNILKYMKLLVQDADKDDHFFIHFSGHSDQEDTDDPEEEDGKNEYILTCWNEKILDDELKAHLVTPLPDGCTLTAIFDSCHSGTLLDLPHYLCNRVHLPFVNKGTRRTNPLWRIQARRRAILPGTREAVCEQPTRIEAVPSSSPTRRVSNSVERGNAAGPVAKTALSVVTKPSNEAPLLCEDICLSPIQNHQYCDGFQCVESPKGGPNVICISSSGDAQETWEDEDGTSVTAELIAIFSVNPHPVLTEVMSTISYRRHEAACILHQQAVQFREERRLLRLRKNRKARTDDFNPEMVNFQIPQLSSLRRVPLNQFWDP